MKKIMLSLALLTALTGSAQETMLERQAQKTKEKINQRSENKVERGIDKTLDKTEETIDNVGKGKGKGKGKKGNREGENGNETAEPANDAQTGTAANGASSEGGTSNGTTTAGTGNSGSSNGNGGSSGSFKANSKFDFVTGDKILLYDDFQRVAIGDFPAEYNTNSSGEVMTIDGRSEKWLGITQNGSVVQELIDGIPDNATIEFMVAMGNENDCSRDGFGIRFFTTADATNMDEQMNYHFGNGSYVYIHPGACPTTSFLVRKNGDDMLSNENEFKNWDSNKERTAKISIWRQGGRLRFYINEEKVWDVPRFFAQNGTYKFAIYHNFYGEMTLLITDLKVAESTADKRNKLLTEGKLVSRGILFDVNSDRIKPESAAAIKEIAAILNEAQGVNVKIVGHTDSDGDDASNLELSKKRALAVKNVLVKDFGVAESRLTTDGKGEAEPVESNATPAGKANNRRVEFIKQ